MPNHTFLYEKMNWSEIDTAAQDGKLALLPVATIEDRLAAEGRSGVRQRGRGAVQGVKPRGDVGRATDHS